MPSVTRTTANRGQQAALCAPTTSTHKPQHRMTQTQTVSHMPTIQRARYRKSRPMNAPGRISALAVAILATALSVLAINCQGNPEPTPTTVPTTAPTATEAYIPPTLTPTRTPIPEPTATQTPLPAATATPTSTPTTAPEGADVGQFNATFDFDSLAKQSMQQQEGNDKLYDVSLHVMTSPDSRQITLQLFCRTPSEPRRKCADEWEIGPELPTEQHIIVNLPAGEHQIVVEHSGSPVTTALVSIDPEAAADPDSAWVEVVYLSEPGDSPEQINEIILSWFESFEDSEQSESQHGDMDESVNEIIARIEAIDELAKESAPTTGRTSADRLFNVPMIVSYEASLAPDQQPVTLQLFCGYRAQPRRKCADDLRIERNAQAERHVSVKLPAGWHNVTVEDNGVPIAHTLVALYPIESADSNEAEAAFHAESETVDAFAVNETLPPGSNGIVPRVTGYWSDGSANVEIFAGNQSITPTDTLICQIGEESSQPCDSETSAIADGRYTRTTMRLPFGVTQLDVLRNNETVLSSRITVGHRTVGIHPDVLDCFTDTTFLDANFKPDLVIGCAGWFHTRILKWHPGQPLRTRLIGPQEWTTFFRNQLEASAEVFNIQFEWVTEDSDADLKAVIGITWEDAFEQEIACPPAAAGCAIAGFTSAPDDEDAPDILIYGDPNGLPVHETELNQLRASILHETVHALTGMGHRIEVGTLMHSVANEFGGRPLTLSPMDHALIQLHAHPDISGGWSLQDVQHYVIPSDELLDTQYTTPEPAPGFNAWHQIYDAFNALRGTASATYNITTSMPACDLSISDATYQVAKLIPGDDAFQWASIQAQQANLVELSHPDFDTETWSQADTGWSTSNERLEDLGWIPILSDPYNMLVSLLLYADWGQVNVINSDSTTTTLATNIDWTHANRRVNIELAIDKDSNTVTEYTLEWSRGTDTCDEYYVTATNGSFGTTFNLPNEIRNNSELISSCETHDLTPNPRALRVAGKWHQECPATTTDATYSETYRFNTTTWSLLRLDFNAPSDAFLVLTDTASGNSQTIDRATGIPFLIGLEGSGRFIDDVDPWQFNLPLHGSYAWHHQWLPPGTYEIQTATRERSFPGRFTLIVDAQPIPGPPESLRFKAVATSIDRTCALLTDGTPLCWGRPHDTSQSPTIPQGTFENIYGGYHYCATNSEGTAQCWDFKEAGDYTCEPEGQDSLASRCFDPDQPEFSNEGQADQSGGFVSGFYHDLAPPDEQTFLTIAPGRHHSCALRDDNTVSCWGSNSNGESTPPTGAAFTDITTSNGYACGLDTNGLIQCWGDDNHGPFMLPTISNVSDIGISFSYGHERTCTLNEQGEVQCFNRRDFYCDPSKSTVITNPCFTIDEGEWLEPGDPGYIPTTPALFNPAPGHTFVALSTGAPECGIKADGTALCWHIWPNVGSPPPTETFTQISAGKHHACGLRTDGTIACWGDNHYGQATPPNGDYLPSE